MIINFECEVAMPLALTCIEFNFKVPRAGAACTAAGAAAKKKKKHSGQSSFSQSLSSRRGTCKPESTNNPLNISRMLSPTPENLQTSTYSSQQKWLHQPAKLITEHSNII